MTEPDNQSDWWNKLVAVGVAILFIAVLWIFRARLGTDFWPLDRSNIGANLVASTITWVIVFTASVLLYPPWRKRVHNFVDRKLSPIHTKLDKHHACVRALDSKVDELQVSHANLLQSHEAVHKKLDSLLNNKPNLES